jgi:hypothetical protein
LKKDEGSAALLFSRLKAQLALSATCFRGIASFGRMAAITEDDSYDRPKRLRSEDEGELWAQQEFHLLASQLYRHLL